MTSMSTSDRDALDRSIEALEAAVRELDAAKDSLRYASSTLSKSSNKITRKAESQVANIVTQWFKADEVVVDLKHTMEQLRGCR